MKKLLILVSLLAACLTVSAQELSCSFTSLKTIKAVHKEIPGSGKVIFRAPDYLSMIYDKPEGEYLIIEGNQLKSAVGGRTVTVDTSKSAAMRGLRNTLINCIMGNYEQAAADNDARLVVEQKGGIKRVSILARKEAVRGYSHIIVDYDAKNRPVRMVMNEFGGIVTEFNFTF